MRLSLLALLLPLISSASTVSRTENCEMLLVSNPRFKFGQVTHLNQTPTELFASPVTLNGQARLVMTVGVPGSGKTTWVSHADPLDWVVLSIDEIRTEVLRQRGFDASSPQSHFQPEILAATQEILGARVNAALEAKKSVILDQNNLTPVRSVWSTKARAAGYHVEALVFSAKNIATYTANIEHRSRPGVLLSQEIVEARYNQFKFFNEHIRVGPSEEPLFEVATDISPFLALSAKYSTLEQALDTMDAQAKAKFQAQLRADFFDKVHFVWTPKIDEMPLDTPVLRNAPRIYAAITNKCNRACPWCAVYSNPSKSTFLEPSKLALHFPTNEKFDLQLEGGEPTIHPKLFEFVDVFRGQHNSGRLILVTNGVRLPRDEVALLKYIQRFGRPFTLKLSINHYLMEQDRFLIEKAQLLKKVMSKLGADYELIFNVRLRRGEQYDNDGKILEEVRRSGLESDSNIFFLQRYGLASGQSDWERPFTVNDGFVLINPDGTSYTGTLEERADMMGKLK